MDKSKASSSATLPNEAFLRQCLEEQTLEYLRRKAGCFNLLVIGEDGLGKVTFLETLFGIRAGMLRDSKNKVALNSDPFNRETQMQIVMEKLTLNNGVIQSSSSADRMGPSKAGKLTVRLMSTVNYGVTETNRQPWNTVSEYIREQVNTYVTARASNPLAWQVENDTRIHCCIYFLPPVGGPGLRRCDLQALAVLDDRVNLIPVLAKADCYTSQELQERKDAVAADIERNSVSVHQYLENKAVGVNAPLAVIGAAFPESTRTLPWGTVSVEDTQYSDVPELRSLILEKNMLMLRKTTKRLHLNALKVQMKPPTTLPRK